MKTLTQQQQDEIENLDYYTLPEDEGQPHCAAQAIWDRPAMSDTGEWVSYEDHQRVHDAASRLLVAINSKLPIGDFSLIEAEYRTLKDALYGK